MSAHEDSSSSVDELALRRQERALRPDQPLRERVRDEARRSARRNAAIRRARGRVAGPPPSPQPFGGGDDAGAA